jgi:uncharacterized protein involved in exopolysaccharide biosynthesis
MAERTDRERLAVIEETVLDLKERLFGNGQPGVIEKHEIRITRLENYRWLIGGAVGLFMAAATLYAALKG